MVSLDLRKKRKKVTQRKKRKNYNIYYYIYYIYLISYYVTNRTFNKFVTLTHFTLAFKIIKFDRNFYLLSEGGCGGF